MKLNQKGAVDFIFLAVLAVLVAAAAFTLWKISQTDETVSDTQANISSSSSLPVADESTENSEPAETSTNDEVPAGVIEVELELTELADIELLPDETPASFVAYMQDRLRQNTPNEGGCITLFSISAISAVNVSGGVGVVEAGEQNSASNCGGGAKVVWYFQDGIWKEDGFQAAPDCSDLAQTTIASDYVSGCYDPESQEIIDSPNPSIEELLRDQA